MRHPAETVPHGVGLVTALVLCMGSGPLLMFGLTAVSPLAVADLGINRLQFGTFATIAFVAATAVSLIAGRLVDRLSERTTTLTLHTGSALALAIAAGTGSYPGVLVGVALSGAAMALSNPVTNRLISAHVPAGRRGLVMGFKQSGVQVGQLVVGLAVPALALVTGWRGALLLAALLAVAGLLSGIRYVPHTPDRLPRHARTADRAPLPRVVWWLAAYALLTGAGLQSTTLYLPLYGHEVLGIDAAPAGLTTALVGGMGLLARIGWGRLTERARSARTPFATIASLAAVTTCGLPLAGQVRAVALFWLCVALFAASAVAANVVVMIAVLMAVPPVGLGRASALASAGMYAGFGVGPVVFGWLVDTMGGYGPGWWAVVGMFALATTLVALGRYGDPTRTR